MSLPTGVAQRATTHNLGGPSLRPVTTVPREILEREKERKWAGEGKKSEILGGPGGRGSSTRGSGGGQAQGGRGKGAGVPAQGAGGPAQVGSAHTQTDTQTHADTTLAKGLAKNGLAQNGLAKNGIGQKWIGQKWVGLKWHWPKMALAKNGTSQKWHWPKLALAQIGQTTDH